MLDKKDKGKRIETRHEKRPFAKSDFEAVLNSATKPLRKEQGEKESKET